MKTNKLRTLLAAGGLGAVALTGAFAATQADAAETGAAETGAAETGAAEAGEHPNRQGPFAELTDAQKECLTDQGLTRPISRPTSPPTQEQIDKLRAAAEECGIELPAHPGRGDHQRQNGERFQQLTQEQRDCLTNAGLTRPEGRPTAEQFEKLRAAASECGIDIPAVAGRPA